jgi:hypothetical protein
MDRETERPSGYYACLTVMLFPIVGILLIPIFTTGLAQLPYALLMIFVVVIPLLGCGFDFRGRPLFQFSYHGEPFVEEVMSIQDDEKVT